MTIKEVKQTCIERHQDKTKSFRDCCVGCRFWAEHEGCMFYNRPIDWERVV